MFQLVECCILGLGAWWSWAFVEVMRLLGLGALNWSWVLVGIGVECLLKLPFDKNWPQCAVASSPACVLLMLTESISSYNYLINFSFKITCKLGPPRWIAIQMLTIWRAGKLV